MTHQSPIHVASDTEAQPDLTQTLRRSTRHIASPKKMSNLNTIVYQEVIVLMAQLIHYITISVTINYHQHTELIHLNCQICKSQHLMQMQ